NDMSADKEITGVIINPDRNQKEVIFDATAPGRYIAEFEGDEIGAYITRIDIKHTDGKEEAVQTGIVLPYSPEYDMNKAKDNDYLIRLAKAGGGRVLETPQQVFNKELQKVWSEIDITPALLILGMLLLMMDITVRRINIPYHRIQQVINKTEHSWSAGNRAVQATMQKMKPRIKVQPKVMNLDSKSEEKKQTTKQTEQPVTHTAKLLDMKKNRKL
ncbi:MAG: hypothetical protein AB7G87_06600, partial [Clostridia bacterium]